MQNAVNKESCLVFVHGYMARSEIFWPMEKRLAAKGYLTQRFGYNSMRLSAKEHAEELASFIDQASEENERVWVVAHSLGGLLACLALDQVQTSRVQGLILIACPLRPNRVAQGFSRWPGAGLVLGDALGQLARGLPEDSPWLFDPPISLGVIAAGTGTADGVRSSLDSDNDGMVRLCECWNEQADARVLVRGRHNLMLMQKSTANAVHQFIQTQSFSKGPGVIRVEHGRLGPQKSAGAGDFPAAPPVHPV